MSRGSGLRLATWPIVQMLNLERRRCDRRWIPARGCQRVRQRGAVPVPARSVRQEPYLRRRIGLADVGYSRLLLGLGAGRGLRRELQHGRKLSLTEACEQDSMTIQEFDRIMWVLVPRSPVTCSRLITGLRSHACQLFGAE